MPTSQTFSAAYRRYTPVATNLLIRITTALGAIRGARVLPAVADQLRASARAGTVHYSNLIEGNQLPFVEAERAARGELAPDTRAQIELINYVAALDFIDQRLADGLLAIDADLLLDLHAIATRGLGRDGDPRFTPRHEGRWRDGVAVVVDHLTGRVMHQAPPPGDVPGLIGAMFEWLDRRLSVGEEPPFVLAGVVHYGITDIHPFADGNGRAARLVQTALLMAADVLPGRLFSFERYYAEDRGAYYAALRSVRRNTLNMEPWLEYFLAGLAEEYERVAATVADLSTLMVAGGDTPLRLTATQERGLAALRIAGRQEFNRRDYERAAGIGRTAATTDISELIQHGVLVPRGAGPGTRYAFASAIEGARPRAERRGRPPTWDDARVERELRAFLGRRETWPTRAEFADAGRIALYSAASRAGGIARWRRVLGR
ncbi:MAG TPA: Fic family protein [Miltoncostaeaceae bacterium]|jgi:Fic family protein|nr:Fic family protein [Miltoncostaeaceae bacterium]